MTIAPAGLSALAWNTRFPPGTLVRYWPVWGFANHVTAATASPAWDLPDGTAVVRVEGVAGGVPLAHVVPAGLPPPRFGKYYCAGHRPAVATRGVLEAAAWLRKQRGHQAACPRCGARLFPREV